MADVHGRGGPDDRVGAPAAGALRAGGPHGDGQGAQRGVHHRDAVRDGRAWPAPICGELTAVAQRLARAAVPEGGVRLIGVSLAGLTDAPPPTLFGPGDGLRGRRPRSGDPDGRRVRRGGRRPRAGTAAGSEPPGDATSRGPAPRGRAGSRPGNAGAPRSSGRLGGTRPVTARGAPAMTCGTREHGHGWVQGAGHGRVTVRFETRSTGPGSGAHPGRRRPRPHSGRPTVQYRLIARASPRSTGGLPPVARGTCPIVRRPPERFPVGTPRRIAALDVDVVPLQEVSVHRAILRSWSACSPRPRWPAPPCWRWPDLPPAAPDRLRLQPRWPGGYGSYCRRSARWTSGTGRPTWPRRSTPTGRRTACRRSATRGPWPAAGHVG